jgi:8-oxo-dGTP pyrophosphatase MutT (NUDIX family)
MNNHNHYSQQSTNNSSTCQLSNNMCNNCGKQGHSFYQCKLPIISYGIILFKKVMVEKETDYQFLMIRRKDSFGYIDLIRGKYLPNNLEQVQGIVNEMSELEKEKILRYEFRELWKMMWGNTVNSQYKNEEVHSAKKFEAIKNGIFIEETGEYKTLADLVKESTTGWKETEWEFPKGRRNNKEKDLVCALREFEEETGIPQDLIYVIENVLPFEETFIGTNYKSYKHKYFLAYIKEEDDLNSQPFVHFQPSEVSKMEWKTLNQCLESIRPYHLEKKQLIQNVYKVLKEYRLFILS